MIYPDFENHKRIHDDFKITVLDLLKDIEINGIDLKTRIEVNTMTINWLKKHIGVEDRKVAEYYKNKG
jgi:hemerythrin